MLPDPARIIAGTGTKTGTDTGRLEAIVALSITTV